MVKYYTKFTIMLQQDIFIGVLEIYENKFKENLFWIYFRKLLQGKILFINFVGRFDYDFREVVFFFAC